MDESPFTASQEVLTGKSPYLAVLAAVISVVSVAIAIFVGLSNSNTSTLLEPTIILGATSGFMVAAGALSKVVVARDRVELTNMFRLIEVKRKAIAGLRTRSGIYIVLINGKRLIPSAYTPALGKRFSSNRRALAFGSEMARILDVDSHVAEPQRKTLSPGDVVTRLRWTTPLYMVIGAVTCVGMAGLARAFS